MAAFSGQPWLRRAALWLGWVLFAVLAWGQAPVQAPLCAACNLPIFQGNVWQHVRGLICENCAKIERRCWICGLPIVKETVKTGDGRWLCRFDAPTAVLTTSDAERVFEETRLEVDRLTGGGLVLKQPQVSVALFDVDYWNNDASGRVAETQRRYGVSHTRPNGAGWDHSVLLHSGLPKVQLMSTCAHELTHLWINENLVKGRALQPDTCEAICELIAYQLMGYMKVAAEQERIQKNAYTHGKIDELIKAEREVGLAGILDWVRHGTTAAFDAARPLTIAPASPPTWNLGTVPKQPALTLRLRGISGPSSRRMAIINDRYFMVGDEKEVALKNAIKTVRCLEIQADAAIIQIDGETNRITLRLQN
jgi:hypothetical protein